MKPTGFFAYWCVALAHCAFIGQCHASPHGALEAAPQPRSLSARELGSERTVTVVTDVQYQYSYVIVDPQDDHALFPAHFWLLFSGTDEEGPLRVEIVSPTIDNRPRGLAIAVTEYAKGHVLPRVPDLDINSARYYFDLQRRTRLANRQIFDPSLRADGHIRSLVEGLWVDNAIDHDTGSELLNLKNFGSSYDFIDALLAEEELGYAADEQRSPEFYEIVDARWWARSRRVEWGRRRRMDRPAAQVFSRISHLFYTGPEAGRSPSGHPRVIRQVFELDQYHQPRRVVAGWQRGFTRPTPRPGLPPSRGPMIRLSRNALLTSDVLPPEKLGSLPHQAWNSDSSPASPVAAQSGLQDAPS